MIAETGMSINEWAVSNGLQPHAVRDVLRGKTAPHKSMAYAAAAALGMLPTQQRTSHESGAASEAPKRHTPSPRVVRAAVCKLLEAQDLLDDACAEVRLYDEGVDALKAAAAIALARLVGAVTPNLPVAPAGEEQARLAHWDAATGGEGRP